MLIAEKFKDFGRFFQNTFKEEGLNFKVKLFTAIIFNRYPKKIERQVRRLLQPFSSTQCSGALKNFLKAKDKNSLHSSEKVTL